MKNIVLLSLLLCQSYIGFSQWEPMNGPYGGSITELVQNDFFQFASTINGLYRSNDNGKTWERLLIGLGYTYATGYMAIRQNQLVVFAYSKISGERKSYLVKSDDNGNSWYTITWLDVPGWAEIAINQYGIYISDKRHLWVSTDQGNTWNYSSLANVGTGLIQYDDQIFVGVYHTIFKSQRDADEWSSIEVDGMNWGIHSIQVFDSVLFVKDEVETLLISTDKGESWRYSLTPSYWGAPVNFININGVFYGYRFDNILKSEDNGLTWDSISTETGIRKMIFVGDTIIAGTSGKGILRSMDSGLSFKPFNKILDASSVDAIDVGQNYLWTGCSFNGVSRQEKITNDWDTILFQSSLTLQDIKLLDGRIFVIKDHYNIYRSDDEGASWSTITPTSNGSEFSEFYTDNHTILVGAPSGPSITSLFKSSDYGATWQPDTFRINNISVWPSMFTKRSSILFTADRYHIYRSNDNGLSWEILDGYIGQGWIADIKASDSLLFAMEESLDKFPEHSTSISRDNGDTWEPLINGYFKFENEINNTLIAIGYMPERGIYVSGDQAVTWQNFDQGMISSYVNEIACDTHYLYAATSGQGVWRRKISDLYTTSTQPISQSNEMSIFPNPTNGNFTLKLDSNISDDAKLSITDISGKVCFIREIALNPQTKVDASTLPSGLYFLSIRSGDKFYTGKIVVQH